jgi:AbrB family looped-hinge helix DNA binding protein
MSIVTVSSRYQITIPKDIRECYHIKPGMKINVLTDGSHISLIPVCSATELQGLLKGYDITFKREEKDRI